MTSRRASDEVSLDIVIALVAGVFLGIVLAAVVGATGWLLGTDLSAFAIGAGVVGVICGTVVVVQRLERSAGPRPH